MLKMEYEKKIVISFGFKHDHVSIYQKHNLVDDMECHQHDLKKHITYNQGGMPTQKHSSFN